MSWGERMRRVPSAPIQAAVTESLVRELSGEAAELKPLLARYVAMGGRATPEAFAEVLGRLVSEQWTLILGSEVLAAETVKPVSVDPGPQGRFLESLGTDMDELIRLMG